MPKRKNAPKAPPASVDDRRERDARVVHREEMRATVGEVLEAEHVDEAIELLYVQDNLAAGRDLNDLSALQGTPVEADAAVDVARSGTDTAPVDVAAPASDHAKSGTPVENFVADVTVAAKSVANEAAAAVGVVKAAAHTIADAVSEGVTASGAQAAKAVDGEKVSHANSRARDENAAEARATNDVEDPATPIAAKPASLLRFLSPRFVLRATRGAVGELVGGVRQARTELREAGERARACFGAVRP